MFKALKIIIPINKNLLQADILAQPIRRGAQLEKHRFHKYLVKLVQIVWKAPETLSLCTAAN
jgi:hypothetical protein